ncbi:MAG: molybdopterin-binding protein [Candidatus Promineifilaceae bacterium]
MRVLLISIGTELLSDILDTNASLAARRFQESNIPLIGKITLADDLVSIAELLQVALDKMEVVVTIGGLGRDDNDLTHKAVAQLTGRVCSPEKVPPLDRVLPIGGPEVSRRGFLLEEDRCTLICLPGKPRDMAYLLETEVLPLLQRRIVEDAAHGWALLRTAGLMESTLEQELVDLNLGDHQRVSFSSFAGQTDIGLWVEGKSQAWVNRQLQNLVAEVLDRLGDQVYGQAGDRLEDVLMRHIEKSRTKMAVAECFTNGSLAQTLGQLPVNGTGPLVIIAPTGTDAELAHHLDLEQLPNDTDLTRWCREAAERLRERKGADVGLVIYNSITPGGVQLLITLASSFGVSVMQRSFGGHPDNITQWASTLGLVHLRRWLLVHHPEAI